MVELLSKKCLSYCNRAKILLLYARFSMMKDKEDILSILFLDLSSKYTG